MKYAPSHRVSTGVNEGHDERAWSSVPSLASVTKRGGHPGKAGFTLIELVISVALMSIILMGAYACLRAGVDSQKLVDSRQELLQNARVALDLLSTDLRGACSLSKEIEFLGTHRTVGDTEADYLDFATHHYTPRHPREGDWCEVSYFLDKNPGSRQFSLWRRRDSSPDEQPFAGGTREEIARGVAGLRFEYYDGLDWYDDWGDPDGGVKAQSSLRDHPNLSGLPEAVRITLWLEPSTTGARPTQDQQETKEPPLAFQTVARLNLAGLPASGWSAGTSTNAPAGGTPAFNPGGQP